MRKIFSVLTAIILSTTLTVARAQEPANPELATPEVATTIDPEVLWQRGNRLYTAGDYNGAVATYDSIVKCGVESAALYYNIAGAYFKAGKSGKAILNYHRSLRLDPANDDAAYNLAYAESFTKDRIEEVPRSAVSRWFARAARIMSESCWAAVSLVALAVLLSAILFYQLSARRKVRKGGFVVALMAVVVLAVSITFGASARHQIMVDNEAIVLSSAAVVKASPDRTSKELFILHEGTKVEVLSEFGEWSEIRIADGNEGWIRTTSIEKI
mgnify:CR=1 FL=1